MREDCPLHMGDSLVTEANAEDRDRREFEDFSADTEVRWLFRSSQLWGVNGIVGPVEQFNLVGTMSMRARSRRRGGGRG